MKKHLLATVFLLTATFLISAQNAQQKVDSVYTLVKMANDSTLNGQSYELGYQIGRAVTDSLFFSEQKVEAFKNKLSTQKSSFNFYRGLVVGCFENGKFDIARKYLEASSKYLVDTDTEGRYFFTKAQLLQAENKFEASKKAYLEANRLFKEVNEEEFLMISYSNMAACCQQLGQYEEAITLQQKALNIANKRNDVARKSTSLNNLSVLYQKLENFEKSEIFIEEAIKIDSLLKDEAGLAGSLINLGIINRKIALEDESKIDEFRLNKARKSYEKALAIAEKISYYQIKAAALANLANLENDFGNYEAAIAYGKQSIAFSEEQNNIFGQMISNLNLAYSYRLNKQYQKAKPHLSKALEIAKQIKFQRGIEECYKEMSYLYKETKQFEKSLEYYKAFTNLKDSLASVEVKNNINELEIKFETEKKERDLAETRANLAESELENEQKNNLIYGSLGLALILGLLGYLFYNQQKLKNRQLKKEAQLKEALVKIETQNKLQEQRLRISRDLHDNIGAQLTFIISSIDNLKYGLKDATQKTKEKLSSISEFTSHTIYELRDTIWAMNKEDITFEDLQVRISNFIEKAKVASEGVHFSFDIDKDINPEHSFTSVVGMNIYRIIQEAVNNALKYAEATAISVKITQESDRFNIQVADNGKGYDMASVEKGNGLNTMEKRAKDINGSVVYTSEVGKGTQVQLKI